MTPQQAENMWKRTKSDKEAVRKLIQETVAAGELTEDQVERLLPLPDMPQRYSTNEHGTFTVTKRLSENRFSKDEVTHEHKNAVHKRLLEANLRGEIYDYDAAAIMLASMVTSSMSRTGPCRSNLNTRWPEIPR